MISPLKKQNQGTHELVYHGAGMTAVGIKLPSPEPDTNAAVALDASPSMLLDTQIRYSITTKANTRNWNSLCNSSFIHWRWGARSNESFVSKTGDAAIRYYIQIGGTRRVYRWRRWSSYFQCCLVSREHRDKPDESLVHMDGMSSKT